MKLWMLALLAIVGTLGLESIAAIETCSPNCDCTNDPQRCGGICYPDSVCCDQGWPECTCPYGHNGKCDYTGPCRPGDTMDGNGYTCVCDPATGDCVWNDNCPQHNSDGSCPTTCTSDCGGSTDPCGGVVTSPINTTGNTICFGMNIQEADAGYCNGAVDFMCDYDSSTDDVCILYVNEPLAGKPLCTPYLIAPDGTIWRVLAEFAYCAYHRC